MIILLLLALSVAELQLPLPRIIRVAFLYTGAQSLMLCATTDNRYGGLAALDQMAISNRAAQVLICVLLLGSYLSCLVADRDALSLEGRKRVLRGLIWVYGLLVLEQLLVPSWGILASLGVHSNPSHMLSLLAAMSPVILLRPGDLHWDRFFFITLLVVCMAFSDALAPAVVLGAVNLAYIAAIFRFSRSIKIIMLGALLSIALVGYLSPGLDNGRFELWGRVMTFYWNHANILVGFGPGSFELFGPKIQHASNFMTGSWFIWMHNDWLQILFELGIVGFILWGLAYVGVCRRVRARKSAYLFASLIGLGVMACMNYPLRQPESIFFGVLLVSLALKRKSKCSDLDG